MEEERNMILEEAQESFVSLMRQLKKSDQNSLLQWISNEWNIEELTNEDCKKEKLLDDIAGCIRKKVPFEAVLPSESLYEPSTKSKKNKAVLHIDEFLYDEDYVAELIETKVITPYKCTSCGSHNVEQMNMISHSCSVKNMMHLFKVLLPDLKGKTLLDVGSRFGAILYGAYILSSAEKIIGIEMNKDLCQITNDVLTERNMLDRVEVINDDILNQREVISKVDAAVVNNAFEYFVSDTESVKCWKFLRSTLKPGCLLVMFSVIDDDFSKLLGEPWANWLKELPTGEKVTSSAEEPVMGAYRVLS